MDHGSAWLASNAAKKTRAKMVLPKGGTQNRHGRNTIPPTTRKEAMQAKAVTADVTPAHMVKCGGNAGQQWRVKCKA